MTERTLVSERIGQFFVESERGRDRRRHPSSGTGFDPYQNAVAERVNGILKAEFILQQPAGHEQAERLVKEAIDAYNNLRPHLSCHYLTPQQLHQQNILLPITYKKSTLPAAAGRVLFSN